MTDFLKLLFLVRWEEKGNWSFPRPLKRCLKRLDFLGPVTFGPGEGGLLNRLSVWASEFYVPFLALNRKREFDGIVSWTSRMGVFFGILNRFCPTSRFARHITHDFHINLVRKDFIHRLRIGLLRLGVPGIDFFLCTSREEEKIYAEMFSIPRERIRFLPLMPPVRFFKQPPFPRRDYIFSYGNSDRDYDTLIEAVKPTDARLVILSQAYTHRKPLPRNVTVISDKVSEPQLIEWISSSRFVVLSLQSYWISAGQLSLLETLALGRPLIVTANMATLEYAIHEETALYFQAGDVDHLRKHIRFLLDNPDIAEVMGQRAREDAGKLFDKRVSIFMEVLQQLFDEQGRVTGETEHS